MAGFCMAISADYAELHCISHHTLLRGASSPEELVARASRLGYRALALTDECSVGGVVRAHAAARAHGLALIIGSELRLDDGPALVLLATTREGYAALCALISHGRQRARKGRYQLKRADFAPGPAGLAHCLALLLPDPDHRGSWSTAMSAGSRLRAEADWLAHTFPGRGWIATTLLHGPDDATELQALQALSAASGLPLVACGAVQMHCRGRRALQDTLTAIRLQRRIAELGLDAAANGERHLRSLDTLRATYPPALLEASCAIAERCRFTLDALRYDYPDPFTASGLSATRHLARLTAQGARRRWPQGTPPAVIRQLRHELRLIAALGYERYFLTVHDLVSWARERGILCQGRGSAANSAVCYALGITAVDPARSQLLFERFISRARNEPPDIDVDFEHERREEVIQYLFERYGRAHAALTATVIRYRPRSAIRDAGKALGLDPALIERLVSNLQWWDGDTIAEQRLREAGLDADAPALRRLLTIARAMIDVPRHLSQHVGGMVISASPLQQLVPIEPASMPDRQIIQWDKDDLDALGMLKIDVLALGMLAAIRRGLDLIASHHGRQLELAEVPADDPAVYAMLQRADSVGVFQIESRAQMAMLPRMRPRCYYDLVIQIAIVRPGPIQGDMVHPYLRRRCGEEPVSYPGEAVRTVLERTLGIPIFQEQVMRLAEVAAGFTPEEADALRRGMAAWRRAGMLDAHTRRLREGMRARGYPEHFAEQILRQIQGFGEYGFPESHAASFALLAYVSAWLKCHYPAAFACALLNSQPMGFYAPAQLLRDAAAHGVQVLPVDVLHSTWDCSLESAPSRSGGPALRLGLRLVKGLSRQAGEAVVAARLARAGAVPPDGFGDVRELRVAAGLNRAAIAALAQAGALRGLAGNRRAAAWQVMDRDAGLPLLEALPQPPAPAALGAPALAETLRDDHASLGFSLAGHPLGLLRPWLARQQHLSAQALQTVADGAWVRTAGLVINRQRPGSARGVTFVTLEDETGQVNLVIWKAVGEAQRRTLVASTVMGAYGQWQREGEVCHLVVGRLEDLTGRLQALLTGGQPGADAGTARTTDTS